MEVEKKINLNDFKLNCISIDNEIEEIITKDIAIVGVDINVPGAKCIEDFWEVLEQGKECIGELSERRQKDIKDYFQTNNRKFKNVEFEIGGYLEEIDEFDHEFFKVTPKESSLMNPAQRLFLEAVKNVIEDSGYTDEEIRSTNTGVYLGMIGDVGSSKYREIIESIEDKSLLQLAVIGNLASVVPGRISYFWDLKGPSMLIDTACSSSLVALHTACSAIRNGECNQAIVGGINLNIIPMKDDIKIGIESKSNQTKPFSNNADGTVIGEGVVALLVKPLNDAIESRDNIYAVIKGSAVNQDGNSMGMTAPNSKAQEEVIVKAWENSGINLKDVSYIEAHGTGTVLGDPIEIEGIKGAIARYANKKQSCAIGSVKSNIGHLYGAAGLIGVVKSILAIKNRQLPASLNFNIPNNRAELENSPVYVNDRLTQWGKKEDILKCGISSFGFSGTNCHVVLQELEREKSKKDFNEKLIFTISEKSKESLFELVEEYKSLIKKDSKISYQDICFTSCVGRDHQKYRIGAIVSSKEELLEFLNNIDFDGVIIQEEVDKLSNLTNVKVNEFLVNRNEKSLEGICKDYVKGADIQWKRFYENIDVNRASIPKYKYNKQRCWVESKKDINLEKIEMRGNENDSYTDIELAIALIIREVLGISEIDINQNFLELGGDSILLTKVYEKINDRYKNVITIPQMFIYSSVKKLSEYINNKIVNENKDKDELTNSNKKMIHKEEIVEEEINEIFDRIESGESSIENALESFMNI